MPRLLSGCPKILAKRFSHHHSPDLANKMQNGTYQTVQTDRIQTGVVLVDKKAGAMLEMNWYMTQMDLIGQGKQPNPKLSAWKVLLKTLWENGKAGLSTGRA